MKGRREGKKKTDRLLFIPSSLHLFTPLNRQGAHKVLGTFWNPDRRILFENVNPDGSFDLDSCDGRHVNPGHAQMMKMG